MTPAQVQAMINTSLASFSNKAQFGVSSVQHHTHNNTDSPKISYKNLSNTPNITVYTGLVSAAGGVGIIFPLGWTVARTNTNPYLYKITHNLNLTNLNYTVLASITTDQAGDSTAFGGVVPLIATPLNANYFHVLPTYFNNTAQTLAAEFFFTVNVFS